MLYSCPNHELSREMIIQKIYARLSDNNRTMLDTSCAGSFMMKTVEFKWDLLDRMKRNSEYWDLNNGKESGMTPKFDCVKSFMDTDAFRGFSAKCGLDSKIVATFCETFATHVDLPKEKWFKYNPPVEVKVVAPITVVVDLTRQMSSRKDLVAEPSLRVSLKGLNRTRDTGVLY